MSAAESRVTSAKPDRQMRDTRCETGATAVYFEPMSTYPKSPKETTKGMMYFPRMLDKIRLHGKSELSEDYHANLGGPKTADGMCTNFLRVNYGVLRQRVLKGGTDEEILEWCYQN